MQASLRFSTHQPYASLATLSLMILILFGLFFRFWQLNAIPVSLYHDELDYVFTGEAVARYGTDITGQWHPWQFRPLHTLNYTAETPVIWHALAQKLFGYGPRNAHTPAAIFGVGSIMVAAFLTYFAS